MGRWKKSNEVVELKNVAKSVRNILDSLKSEALKSVENIEWKNQLVLCANVDYETSMQGINLINHIKSVR